MEEVNGVVVECNDNLYVVKLDDGRLINAHLSSRIVTNRIRIFVNDEVSVRVNGETGAITYKIH